MSYFFFVQRPSYFCSEYYLSDDNLARDIYLRRKMDRSGWLSLDLIATFPRIFSFTNDMSLIVDSLKNSDTVEMSEDNCLVRPKNSPERWPLPDDTPFIPAEPHQFALPLPTINSPVESVSTNHSTSPNENNINETSLAGTHSENGDEAQTTAKKTLNPNVGEFVPSFLLYDPMAHQQGQGEEDDYYDESSLNLLSTSAPAEISPSSSRSFLRQINPSESRDSGVEWMEVPARRRPSGSRKQRNNSLRQSTKESSHGKKTPNDLDFEFEEDQTGDNRRRVFDDYNVDYQDSDNDSDEVSDEELDMLLVVAPSQGGLSRRNRSISTSMAAGSGPSQPHKSRVKVTQELAQWISDGLYFYEMESKRDRRRNKRASSSTSHHQQHLQQQQQLLEDAQTPDLEELDDDTFYLPGPNKQQYKSVQTVSRAEFDEIRGTIEQQQQEEQNQNATTAPPPPPPPSRQNSVAWQGYVSFFSLYYLFFLKI